VKLAVWAKACAERVLSYFEKVYPEDKRPREALRVLGEWIETGEFRMPVIRGASLGAHAAVRGVEGNASAVAAAHAAGQAVASAHVVTHALGAALYAQKAVAAANPEDAKTAVEAEKSWQLAQLSGRLQAWVGEQLSIIQRKSSLFRPIV
jgi:hypothetical protein